MKKALVYMHEGALAKTGGPIGYNFALKSQLDKMGVDYIDYLPGGKPFKPGLGKKLKKTWYGNILKTIKDWFRFTYAMFKTAKPPIDIYQYDLIHFHSVGSMFQIRKYLKKYNGIVMLTSHSPRAAYLETMSIMTPWNQKHMRWHFNKLKKIDEYAFSRANYIMFPCEDAEEPYFNTWSDYKDIKTNKKDNYRYVPTGTYNCSAKKTREEVCREMGIPNDAFIICYVGRHNDVKGYDKLKEIGEKILAVEKNVYFIIAGEEYPLKGLENERWKEVGWTNDPHSYIAASDIFVLPNKETYFDLIMLEVLSLSKIVVASRTGGNKYFEKIGMEGVKLYDNITEAVSLIRVIISLSDDKKRELEVSNKAFFSDCFSLEVFGNSYQKLVDSLLAIGGDNIESNHETMDTI